MNKKEKNEANMVDQAQGIYDDMQARPDMYKSTDFNPLNYLRQTVDEEGNRSLSLDIKYRKHWFRLVHPNGKIVSKFSMTDQGVIFEARVYADKADTEDSFLAAGHAYRDRGGADAKAYERFYVDWAETMAVGRALTNAGFDVPWVNIPALEGVDPTTGELVGAAPVNPVAPTDPAMQRQGYSSVTAPPAEHEAATGAQTPGGQQVAATGAQAPGGQQVAATGAQTPGGQQVAATGAQTPGGQVAQTPAQQQAAEQALASQSPQGQAAVQLPDFSKFPPTVEEAMTALNVEIAKTIVVNFGKNNGKTLGEVAQSSPGDLDWFVNSYKGKNTWIKAGAALLIQTALANAS